MIKKQIDTLSNYNHPCCPCCGNKGSIAEGKYSAKYSYRTGVTDRIYFYRFYDCSICSLGFVYPVPDVQALAAIYSRDYVPYQFCETNIRTQSNPVKLFCARAKYIPLNAGNCVATFGGKVLSVLLETATGRSSFPTFGVPLSLPKDSAILDYGYGSGSWLLLMKQLGYTNLFGYDIEPNKENTERLQKAGITLLKEDEIKEGTRIKLIRLEQVFEHLLEPSRILSLLYNALNTQGYLVLNSPCKSSLIYSLVGLSDSRLVQLPRHLLHNTKKSIKYYLQNAGFKKIRIYLLPHSNTFYDAIIRKYPKIKILKRIKPLIGPIYFVFAKVFQRGEYIAVVAQKD